MHGHDRGAGRTRLRVLSVAVPLAGLAGVYLARLFLLRMFPLAAVDIGLGLVLTAGVAAFSWSVFRVIDRQDRYLARQHSELWRRYELERRLRGQLEALHQASLALASAQTTEHTLQRLAELARDLIGARYAALGVIGAHGVLDSFYAAGISDEERRKLGAPPQGHGLLGVVLTEGTALRIRDIAGDPRSIGFPPGHPVMKSLMVVPVIHGDHIVGNLYLADKAGALEFSPEDERLLTMLAGHAAAVIENARLADRVQMLAIAAERNRISKDLHDGVIQAIYAVNLGLETAVEDVPIHPDEAVRRIDDAIDRLGDVMNDVRRYIVGLQSENGAGESLPDALAALLAETRAYTLLDADLHVEGAGARDLPAPLAGELFQIAREVVTNVVRHARAGHVWVTLRVTATDAFLRIDDDGMGFDPSSPAPAGHYGLSNIRDRAAQLGGTVIVQSSAGRGTTVDVRTPMMAPQREATRA